MALADLCAFSPRAAALPVDFLAESISARFVAKGFSFWNLKRQENHVRALRKQALDTDLVEVTVAKSACGFRRPVLAFPSVVWLALRRTGPSEAS